MSSQSGGRIHDLAISGLSLKNQAFCFAQKFRSTGEESAKKSIKEQVKEAAAIRGGLLTKAAPPEVEGPKLNPLQTLLGAVMAAIIALVLYKFTTTVEAGFSDKAVSSNYSVCCCPPHHVPPCRQMACLVATERDTERQSYNQQARELQHCIVQ
jgi:hypothetical protein